LFFAPISSGDRTAEAPFSRSQIVAVMVAAL
jgi:hypothetical protein